MKNIKFTHLLIAVLIAIVFIQRCGKQGTKLVPTITVVHDTTWEIRDSLIYSKPKIVKSESVRWDTITQLIPDTTYKGLLNQYTSLGEKHFSKNMYADSLPVDSVGYLLIKDTVQGNQVVARSVQTHFKFPKITTTVTIQQPYEPKGQVYVGGGILGSPSEFIKGAELGILYKNKKDQMFGVKAQLDQFGLTYGVQSYWKISLKKK